MTKNMSVSKELCRVEEVGLGDSIFAAFQTLA